MQRRSFLAGAGGAVFAGALAARPARAETLHQSGADWFTNVEVTSQDGRTFRFYDDLMRDKVIMVNFFYTSCNELCPLMTQNLAAVTDLLGERMGRDVFMYSISLDPTFDTPERLASYAKANGVGPGWLLLTGKPDDIELLRHRLGYVDSDPLQDADRDQHLGAVRIANVPLHRWVMSPALVPPAAIIRTLKRAIPEPA